jgi:hypothetical protein
MKTLGKVEKKQSGFEILRFKDSYGASCVVQKSSVCDESDTPGRSALWIGQEEPAHLSRSQVEALINHLQSWLSTGSLEIKEPEQPPEYSVSLFHNLLGKAFG